MSTAIDVGRARNRRPAQNGSGHDGQRTHLTVSVSGFHLTNSDMRRLPVSEQAVIR